MSSSEASSLIRAIQKWSFPKGALHEKVEFSEEHIVRILKEVEAGAKFAETYRKLGISDATYYIWKSKYAGMEVSHFCEKLFLNHFFWRTGAPSPEAVPIIAGSQKNLAKYLPRGLYTQALPRISGACSCRAPLSWRPSSQGPTWPWRRHRSTGSRW
ncbi:transposase [Dyella jejuensis]|uniref:Transposase n=1 Tax=Dyella jejuensis TaxID=1432009 RepID=A0ABW8JKE3_9GAMM